MTTYLVKMKCKSRAMMCRKESLTLVSSAVLAACYLFIARNAVGVTALC